LNYNSAPMQVNGHHNTSNFYVAGISYKKTDATTRSQFAISQNHYAEILQQAYDKGVDSLFILSTCNRTEIYGFADNADTLITVLCSQSAGSADDFRQNAYVKTGLVAIDHLFRVGAGLDSQILGDYEIVGQLKQAVKLSKEHGWINNYMERLVNSVLQSSKEVKNNTGLSGGMVSVSFAAVQYIKEHVVNYQDCRILLTGTGKIGRNTCKNLVDYLETKNITLVNRTEERAAILASELGLQYAPIADLAAQVAQADIILVATSADEPAILTKHLENWGTKLIIDLSVPNNVERSARDLPNVTLINVDELSKIKDETLKKREADVPAAKAIIAQHLQAYLEWCRMRKNTTVLSAIKDRLNELSRLHQREFDNPHTRCPYIAAEQRVQQVINGIAGKMRAYDRAGCYYLEAINDFMEKGD